MESQSVTLLSDGQIKSLFRNQTPDPGFILSTVSVADTLRLKWSGDSALNQRIQRCTQWIAICARFKARFCAGQTLRLYREARKGKPRGATWKRVTDRARLKHLRSPLVGKQAGYAMDADDIEEVTDHPVLDLLKRPNPFTTGHALALSRWMDKEVCGNAFLYVDAPEHPDGLYRLAPHKTAVIPSRTTFIEGYRYGASQELKRDFPVEMIDHYKFMPGLVSPYLGDSWVQDVILDADRYAASTQSDLSLQTRGGRPDWAMKLPPGSNADTVKQAREEVRRQVGGPSKTGSVLFTTAEEIIPLQWRPKDLEAIASREDAKLIICNAAGVPETMMAMQNANRAGADAGLVQFARMTAAPQLAQDAAELTEMLLPRYPDTDGYWFCYDNPVPEDEEAEVDAHKKLSDSGLMTLNQSLAERGFDPVGAEGDVYRFNGVPLASLAAQADAQASSLMGKPGDATKQDGAADNAAQQASALAGDVQATALNGAQVTALNDLLQSVATGKLPQETARAAIAASYPTLTEQQIAAMIDPLIDFEPTPEAAPNGQNAGNVSDGGQAGSGDGGGTGGSDVPPKAGSKHNRGGDGAGGADRREWSGGGEDGVRGLWGDFTGDSDCGGFACCLPDGTAAETKDGIWIKGFKHPAFTDAGWDIKCACCTKDFAGLTPEQRDALADIERACREWFKGLDPKATSVQGEIQLPAGASDRLMALLREPMARLVEAAAVTAGSDASMAVTSDSALKFLDHYLPKLAQQITMDTRAGLADAAREGIAGGESIGQIQERVARALGDQTNYRAERIARTEVTTVYNRGKMETWKEVGVTQKRWLVAPGACEFCQAMGEKYPESMPMDFVYLGVGQSLTGTEGGVMTNTWLPVLAPGLHPNDYCSVIPVVE